MHLADFVLFFVCCNWCTGGHVRVKVDKCLDKLCGVYRGTCACGKSVGWNLCTEGHVCAWGDMCVWGGGMCVYRGTCVCVAGRVPG